MRTGGLRYFSRDERRIFSAGLTAAIAIFMAAPDVSAQSSLVDRPIHVDCSAMTASAAPAVTAGAAADIAVMPGSRHRVTAAGSHLHALAQPLNIQPGQYEGTAEVSIPGTQVKMPPSTSTYCISEKDREGWAKNLPAPSGYTCTVTEYQQDGNKVTITRVCKGKDNTTTWHGEVTFASTSYSGTWNITNSNSGRTSTMKFAAKRIGDCPK